jgi:hypothetical protein
VSLLGADSAILKDKAKQLASENKLENVAVVVPEDQPNGPDSYKINPHADVTVLIYKQGKVEANHAVNASELNDQEINHILADTSKILN